MRAPRLLLLLVCVGGVVLIVASALIGDGRRKAREDNPGRSIDTPRGPVAVSNGYRAARGLEPPPGLDALLQQLAAASIPLERARLGFAPVTGPRLEGDGILVLPGDVLREEPNAAEPTTRHHANARAELERATRAYLIALGRAPLPEDGRRAAAGIVGGIPKENGREYWGSLQPSITRRLVRHGWLQHLLVEAAATRALQEAVLAATRPVPVRTWRGARTTLTVFRNVFGRETTVLDGPAAVRIHVPQPAPQWLGRGSARSAVIELAPGSDPLVEAVEPLAAELWVGGRELGRWRRPGALNAETVLWQQRVARKLGKQPGAAPGLFPPHILVTGIRGDARLLVTRHGVVRPAADGSPAEMQRFMDEAVAALPDAPHLDLIGELLYDYAWDTPQYDNPLLLGTQHHNGDIHQTAQQTLTTSCGGIVRGDCDDMACLYHALALHQGRNAHVLSVPWHLACAWAEKRTDGTWAVHVLHTGPPLEIRGGTLDEALGTTVKHFKSHESIDANALPISLRFGGDAVRQRYLLPAEIFVDRDYARALIDVQSAYRFHTYLSGAETMSGILAQRASPTAADYREGAHLLRYAGRIEAALPLFRSSLARAVDPATRVDAALDLLATLTADGRSGELTALADRLEKRLIPTLEDAEGKRLLSPWLGLGRALLGDDAQRTRGLGILAEQARRRVMPSVAALRKVVGRDGFDPQWLHYSGFPLHEGRVNEYRAAALAAVAAARDASDEQAHAWRAVLDGDLREWFREIAFPTVHSHASVLGRYAELAGWLAAQDGEAELALAVAAAGPPALTGHARDRHASEPVARALRWIHIAPGYRRAVWWRGFTAEADAFEARSVKRALAAELAAFDAAAARGLAHWSHVSSALVARLALALLARDESAFREGLETLAASKDHGARDALAALLGASARRLDLATWRRWLPLWADALDHAPHYFQIAWAARRAGRHEHALAAARLAVQRHAEQPALARELALMQALEPAADPQRK